MLAIFKHSFMEIAFPNSRAVSVAVTALQLVYKTYPWDQKSFLVKTECPMKFSVHDIL